jgi:phospholipase C
MNGFYKVGGANNAGDGQRALSWYDQRDIPFYYWLYSTFAMSDRFFCAALGPTWPNRDFVYAGTSDGVKNTFERAISVPTLFNKLEAAHIPYGVYADNGPRQSSIGWTSTHAGFAHMATFYTALANGTLPKVVFVDGEGAGEEHPPANIEGGEAFAHKLFTAAFASPLWPKMAIFYTYDEAGGFFDHVPPPAACKPSAKATDAEFNRLGIRMPFVVVSPWAKPGYVSHVPLELTGLTRFVEAMFDLPALTKRDANADLPLDLFDFSTPHLMHVPAAPASGTGGCP